MKYYHFFVFICFGIALTSVAWAAPEKNQAQEKPVSYMEKPLMERYVFDELRELRKDLQALKADVVERVAQAKLEASDRALRYTADTTNNIFYIITAAASLLVLVGWKSLRDMKDSIETATMSKLSKLIDSYEERLDEVERSMKLRSNQLIETQEEISNTNKLHSLWMRAGIAKNNDEKISCYDEILELQPDDVEALTYKADTLLDMGEAKWALSLTNLAIQQTKDYSLAYWQRACAYAELGQLDEAMADLSYSVELSPVAAAELMQESFFEPLQKDPRFKTLVSNAG